MNEFVNNEYFHLALSVACVVWGVWNLGNNQDSSSHSKSYLKMDMGYSYLLIGFGVILIIWSIVNIAGA